MPRLAIKESAPCQEKNAEKMNKKTDGRRRGESGSFFDPFAGIEHRKPIFIQGGRRSFFPPVFTPSRGLIWPESQKIGANREPID